MALNVGLVSIDQYDDIAKIERIDSSSGIRKTNLSKLREQGQRQLHE